METIEALQLDALTEALCGLLVPFLKYHT